MNRPRLPNLFVIGAMKSGTTSLHALLGAHPQIFMSEPKEPGFFVEELTWSKGLEWYLSLFAAAGTKHLLGESSTHYTKRPIYQGVPERLHHFNPDARLVYVMRDPVERLASHYWYNVRSLSWDYPERRDMLTAVRRDPQYLAFSDYAMQLGPYLDLFGRDAVYALTFEELVMQQEATVRRLCEWLDVEVASTSALRALNVMPDDDVERVRGLGILNRFSHTRLWGQMAPMVPQTIKRLGKQLAWKPVSGKPAATQPVLEYARSRLLPAVEALVALLGRDFSEWATLYDLER